MFTDRAQLWCWLCDMYDLCEVQSIIQLFLSSLCIKHCVEGALGYEVLSCVRGIKVISSQSNQKRQWWMMVLIKTPEVKGVYSVVTVANTIIRSVKKWVVISSFTASRCSYDSACRCHMGLKLFSNLFLLISAKGTLLHSHVALLLMRLKLLNTLLCSLSLSAP